MSLWLSNFRKTAVVLSVYVQDNLNYRSMAVIWMMTDAVPAMLMPLMWLASYQGREQIAGFAPGEMVAYYLTTLCLTSFMISHIMWDVAVEVREGRFSIYLTRPFSYFLYQYANNLSWRLLRLVLFVPIFGFCWWIFHPYLRGGAQYHLGPAFWLSVLGGHLLSYSLGYTLGLLALFFTEVRSLFMFYYLPAGFLSGEMVPLATLPAWAGELARMLPFRYTLAFSAEIFMNRLSPQEVVFGFGWMGAWLVITAILMRVLWRTGLRQYTGVGM